MHNALHARDCRDRLYVKKEEEDSSVLRTTIQAPEEYAKN